MYKNDYKNVKLYYVSIYYLIYIYKCITDHIPTSPENYDNNVYICIKIYYN